MIEPSHPTLSISRQCALLSLARSSFYYTPKGESETNLAPMRQTDEQFLETPFYGVGQTCWHLRNEGHQVNQKRRTLADAPDGPDAHLPEAGYQQTGQGT
jgi:putative transposase